MARACWVLLMTVCLAHAGESLGVRVNRGLDRAAAHLVKGQAADGSWQSDDKVHPLGRTALCTYALLHAGLAPDHAAVAKGVAFLAKRGFKPISTYEAGCLLLLLHALGPAYEKQIHEICAWLVSTFDRGPKLWGYPVGHLRDLSNTQFAVFGLKVGEMHGFKVPTDLWKAIAKGALQLQYRNGAFKYDADDLYSASMTHAGLIVLRFATKKPPRDIKQAMERGHEWYERHFTVARAPHGRGHREGHYYYYMYGLSRYAQIFGMKQINGHDWYREGAEELLRRQGKDGGWGPVADTCFAVLFLKKVVFTRPTARAGAGKPVPEAKEQEPERPRPKSSVGCLRRWLVAGPYPGDKEEDDMLYREHFKMKRLQPGPGRRAGKREWKVYESPEDRVDLEKALGEGDGSTFYLALYIHAKAATDAFFWLGCDDGAKVFLNAEEIFLGHHHDYSGDDFYSIGMKLRAGRNLLVIKLENYGYFAAVKARLSDLEGGVHFGLTPSVKRKAPVR